MNTPFELYENTDELVVLKIINNGNKTEFNLEATNWEYITVTKGKNHALSVIDTHGNKINFGLHWGEDGSSLFLPVFKDFKDAVVDVIEKENGINLNEIAKKDTFKLKACIENLSDYNSGIARGWYLSFPCKKEEAKKFFDSIGIKDLKNQEIIVTDYECNGIDFNFEDGEYPNIDELNCLASILSSLDKDQLENYKLFTNLKVLDICERNIETYIAVARLCERDEINECFTAIPNIYDDSDLGEYMIDELGMYAEEIKGMGELGIYVDSLYEPIGRDIRINDNGEYKRVVDGENLEWYYTTPFNDAYITEEDKEIPEEYKISNFVEEKTPIPVVKASKKLKKKSRDER